MSLITRVLRQNAVLWARSASAADDFGQPLYSAPVQIKCRWADHAMEFVKWDGTKETSQVVAMVDRDIAPGAVLMLGVLADVTDLAVPQNNPTAREVRGFRKIPNMRATEFVRKAFL